MNYSLMETRTVTSSNPFPFKYIVHSFVSTAALMTSLIGFNGGTALPFDQEPNFRHIPFYYQGISEVDSVYNGCSLSLVGGRIVVDDNNMKSKRKLLSFLDYGPDWNGYGAVPFSREYIKKAERLLSAIPVKTEVFPISDGRVQFEFDKEDGAYLEFEINDDGTIHVFQILSDQTEREYDAKYEDLKGIVTAFYG